MSVMVNIELLMILYGEGLFPTVQIFSTRQKLKSVPEGCPGSLKVRCNSRGGSIEHGCSF